ncbi:hypothetical protein RJ639_031137 [Escallonia herrerae]|uniref:Uncharacterized protein n=1 Tax=Escallonia herrerae TaxID=1293975 RepID=A0AA88X173_9ASTE|nr:hypothetical protein RJ639_031137 [Escallonia herrerae]
MYQRHSWTSKKILDWFPKSLPVEAGFASGSGYGGMLRPVNCVASVDAMKFEESLKQSNADAKPRAVLSLT